MHQLNIFCHHCLNVQSVFANDLLDDDFPIVNNSEWKICTYNPSGNNNLPSEIVAAEVYIGSI